MWRQQHSPCWSHTVSTLAVVKLELAIATLARERHQAAAQHAARSAATYDSEHRQAYQHSTSLLLLPSAVFLPPCNCPRRKTGLEARVCNVFLCVAITHCHMHTAGFVISSGTQGGPEAHSRRPAPLQSATVQCVLPTASCCVTSSRLGLFTAIEHGSHSAADSGFCTELVGTSALQKAGMLSPVCWT